MSTTNPAVHELRDSVAFSAGIGHERRRIAERLRQRASHIDVLWERFNQRGYRMTSTELRRMADEIEGMQ